MGATSDDTATVVINVTSMSEVVMVDDSSFSVVTVIDESSVESSI